ncbi:MAG: PepSY domain-containing protein, partial [Geminicoccaceae bacterium]
MATNATFEAVTATSRLSSRLYNAVWRWHFYAGLYVVPFLLMLAITGLIMLWVNALDGREGERGFRVAPQATPLAVSALGEAARAAVPDGVLTQYLSPKAPDLAALFRVDRGEDAQMVAVDPFTGSVLGQWPRRAGWYDFAETIHGTLMLGTVGDGLIEIAAGFGIVLILTGLYLWWPRQGEGVASALLPNLGLRGRAWWKSLHRSMGFWIAAILLVFLLSGLSWTGVWGAKFVQAWSTFPAEKWDNVPVSDETHAAMNHGGIKEVPWALEQTPMPASGSPAGSAGIAAGVPVDLDGVAAFARAAGLSGRFQIALLKGEAGVWTISQDSMSGDGPDPTS